MKLSIIIKTKLLPLILSKTARNTYFIFSGNSLAMVLAFFYTIILYRIVSISDFGYYSALFSFLLLLTDIADIGIGSSLSRFLPPLKKNPIKMFGFLKSAFLTQFTTVFLIFIIIVFAAPFISQVLFHSKDLITFVRIVGLGIVGAAVGNFFLNTLYAKEKFVTASIFTIITALARLVFLLVLAGFAIVSLSNVIWALVGSFIFGSLIGMMLVNPVFLFHKSTKSDIRILLGFSSFLGIARTLTAVSSRLDVLMLMALTNSVETGIYSTASRVASLYPVFTASFISVVGPRVAVIKEVELKNYFTKIILATIGLIVTILIFILIAKPFMVILFSEKSLPSVPVLRSLLISMMFFTGSIPGVALSVYYLKKPFILTVNSILQLITVIFGNLIFIPHFGRIGAAFSLIAAYGLSFLLTSFMSFYYLKKEGKVKTRVKFDTITPPETI